MRALALLGTIRLAQPVRSTSLRMGIAVICGMGGALGVSFVVACVMLLASGRFDLTPQLVVIERATALSMGVRRTVMLVALAGAGPAAWLGCTWYYHGWRVHCLRGMLLCGATAAATWCGMILSDTSMTFALPGIMVAVVVGSSTVLGVYCVTAGAKSGRHAGWRWIARVLWVAAALVVLWCGQWYEGYTSVIRTGRAHEAAVARTQADGEHLWWQAVNDDYRLDDVDAMLVDARAAARYSPADDYIKLLLGETLVFAHRRSEGIQELDETIADLRRGTAAPDRAQLLASAEHYLQQVGARVPEN